MVQAVENQVYAFPNTEGAKVNFKERYDNYIGGKWTAPVKGQYFDNPTPVTGKVFTEVARSTAEDIELALDAAHAAKDAWGKTSVTERSNILLKIADRMEQNLEMLAVAETWENGKAVRETLNADFRLQSTISAILQVQSVRKKAASVKLIMIRLRTISMSRLGLLDKLFLGTSRF